MPPLQEEESIKYPELSLDTRVMLNVGGIRHEVLWQTLGRLPNTRLGRLRTCDTRDALLALCDGYCSQDNEYYFDRTSTNFYAILNLYRTGKFHILHETCALSLQDDLHYWQISDAYLEPCCRRKYFESGPAKVNRGFNVLKHPSAVLSQDRRNIGRRKTLWNLLEVPDLNSGPMVHQVSYLQIISKKCKNAAQHSTEANLMLFYTLLKFSFIVFSVFLFQ